MSPHSEKKYEILQPLLLSLAVVIGMIIGVKFSDKKLGDMIEKLPDAVEVGNGRVEDIIRFIENKYVDDVQSDSLIEIAVNSIMTSLDPHSVYISPDQLEQVNDQMKGSFDGIGMETLVIDDQLAIVTLLDDGPAKEAGLQLRDRIITVNHDSLVGDSLDYSYVSKHLSGEKGDTLDLTIMRDGAFKEFTVVIDEVKISSIGTSYEIEEGIGYIQLSRFSASSYKEFMESLEYLVENEEIEDLIIDLRDNPGGYLPETTKILSQLFKEKDRLMVYTKGRNSKEIQYKTNGQNFFEINDVVVLINENSASGSEILAGAIQDWDRGLVVGRRSFGKGLVQEQYSLSNGGAIRLTVSRYYTPTGRSIQRPYTNNTDYHDDLNQRIENGELFNGETHTSHDTATYYTKILGRKMHGGGGITPDHIVAVDSVQYMTSYQEMTQNMPAFIFKHIENTENQLFQNEAEFLSLYDVDEDLLESYINSKFVNADSYSMNPQIKRTLRKDLKATLAKQLFSDEARIKSDNINDPDVLNALEALAADQLVLNHADE